MGVSKNSAVNKCLWDLPILALSLHNKILLPWKPSHDYTFIYILKIRFPAFYAFQIKTIIFSHRLELVEKRFSPASV